MFKKKFNPILKLSFLMLFFNIITNCENSDERINCFPKYDIRCEVSDTRYPTLNSQGWAYTYGEFGTGTAGLIIYKAPDNTYRVYDRNAPHICPDSNTRLEVKDNLYIVCPKDNAQWILSTGEPIKGTSKRLITYTNITYIGLYTLY